MPSSQSGGCRNWSGSWPSKKENAAAGDNQPACPTLTIQNEALAIQHPQLWNQLPKGHQFCIAQIALFLDLVLSARASLRGAAQSLELVLSRLFGPAPAIACANSGRLWLLRLGLYELTRPKQQADDWVWIVDHTIQISSVKCLLIVGCRLETWQQQRKPLEHHDLQVLALEPVETSSGEVVCQQLEQTVAVTGVPRAIVSDGGSDLTRGISLFRQQHPQVTACYDIAHKMAIFLKKILTNDPRWQEFLKKMAQCKKQFAKSSLAFLTPPMVPDQARYMNLEGLLKWASRVRHFMDDPAANDGSLVEPWRVKLEFAWLRDFDEPLAEWQELMHVVETALHFVRWEGYHRDAHVALHARLLPYGEHPQSHQLCEQVVNFVAEQSLGAKADERLIGSSECLESLIGKGKRLEGQQSRSGFTAMVLGMAAAVIKPTQEVIEQALATVKVKDVAIWVKQKLGHSVQARRRLAFQAESQKSPEQKRDNIQTSTTPSF